MDFKSMAFSAATSFSLVSSTLPAFAQHIPQHHPVLTPIQCNFCDEPLSDAGAFSYFGTNATGHFLTFGETDTLYCYDSFVGARIDAQGFPAQNWSIHIQTANENSEPVFVTEVLTSSGRVFTTDTTNYIRKSNSIQASFNAAEAYPGATFVSIWVYDSGLFCCEGRSFRDTILLGPDEGTLVDGVYPISTDYHSIVQQDCTGYSNANYVPQ